MYKLARLVANIFFTVGLFIQPLFAQPAPDKLTIGTITLSLNNLPIYIA